MPTKRKGEEPKKRSIPARVTKKEAEKNPPKEKKEKEPAKKRYKKDEKAAKKAAKKGEESKDEEEVKTEAKKTPQEDKEDTKEETKDKKGKKKVDKPAVKKEEVVPPLAPLVDVIVFGSGEVGQLGLGNEVLEKKKPGIVPPLQNKHVVKLAVGGLHAAVLAQDPNNPRNTSLWTWGCNDQKILGRETPSSADEKDEDLSMIPGLVPTLEGKHIVDVTTGDFHMLALDNQGRVYVWGTYKDQEGFLGFTQEQKSEQDVPIILPDLKDEKVVQIASGYNHSLVLTDKGEVLEWGLVWIGRKVSDRNRKSYLKPTRVFFPRTKSKSPKIVSIHAGGYHSFAITEDGRVFSWGLNNAGQLGVGTEVAHAAPVEVTALRNKDIFLIVGGQHHSVALSRGGQVYSFGRGDYGQLGHGGTEKELAPREISPFVEAGGMPFRKPTKDIRLYSFVLGQLCKTTDL